MRYAVLLRGINVGGKNKVDMVELKTHTSELGYENVATYINSGNLFFDSEDKTSTIKKKMEKLFEENYPFIKAFSLISKEEYERDYEKLPPWWNEDLARKDVLFYTDKVDKKLLEDAIKRLEMTENEVVAFGQIAVYWGKYDEADFLKTTYHKQLLKMPFYKEITIRNGKTFEKIGEFLKR